MSAEKITYRERRERKAERLREWAAKREAAGASAYERSRELAELIPFGQPILVGHYSEGGHRAHIARIDSAMRQAVENSGKAANMGSRAGNIEAQLRTSIYDDDPDAIERLEEKLRRMEAQREAMKAANAAFRKAHRAELKELSAFHRDRAMPHQGYEITNLGGNISRTRDRLARLKRDRDQGPADRIISARFDSECAECGAKLSRGDSIRYNRQNGARCYPGCYPGCQS